MRNMVMAIPGSVAPVVYGGRLRAILAYMDRSRMQARNLSPLDLMKAIDEYNIFLPTGAAKFGKRDYLASIPIRCTNWLIVWAIFRSSPTRAARCFCAMWPTRKTPA